MSLDKFLAPLLVVAFSALFGSLACAQTPPAEVAKPAAAAPAEPKKSKRLDKHAPPWEVIWNSRLWTDVPDTQDFVKATHPEPKSLEYAPLVAKDPERPKARDAAGIAALRSELEGDSQTNATRGKAINDIAPPAEAAKPAPPPKSAKARRAKRTAKGASKQTAKAASESTAAKAN